MANFIVEPSALTSMFLSGELPTRSTVIHLLENVQKILAAESTIIRATLKGRSKFHVVGDIHGQFFDLQNGIFKKCGYPSPTNAFVFNGDIVDRGSWGIECLLLLLAWKFKYPQDMFLTRGNHESEALTTRYGFKDECIHKYDKKIYKLCLKTFCCLPLGVILDDHTFIVHGGLVSKNMGNVSLEELNRIHRFREPSHDKGDLMMEMLWSDPMENLNGIEPNNRGGNTIMFGPDITNNFCKLNNLKRVIRSHQVVEQGILSHHNSKLFTIFSAPNYCDSRGNIGSVIIFDSNGKMDYIQFEASNHPDIPPMAYQKKMKKKVMSKM
jgi:serine/threonine-protein phosphatase 5